MHQFFHDRNAATTGGVLDAGKKGFSLFGKKKGKAEIAAPLPLPVTPVKPKPVVSAVPIETESEKPTDQPKKRLVKKGSTEIDHELKQLLQRDGMAYLAFAEQEKTTPAPKPVAKKSSSSPARSAGAADAKDGGVEQSSVVERPKTLAEKSPQVKVMGDNKPLPEQPAPQPSKTGLLRKDRLVDSQPPAKENVPIPTSPPSSTEPSFRAVVSISPPSTRSSPAPERPNGRSVNFQRQYSDDSNTAPERPNGRSVNFQRQYSDDSNISSGSSPAVDLPSPGGLSALPRSNPRPEATARVMDDLSSRDRSGSETSIAGTDATRSHRNSAHQHPEPPRGPDARGFSGNGQPSRPRQAANKGSMQPRSRPSPPMRRDTRSNSPPTPAEEDASHPPVAPEERRPLSFPLLVMAPPAEYESTLNDIQRSCEISHKQSVLSSNIHHRIMCMICLTDASTERWTCSYCAVRFCTRCKSEFLAGKPLEQVLEVAESEDWRSQSLPPSPARGSPERNLSWELASYIEGGGRLRGPPQLRAPPPGRKGRLPPPQFRRSPNDNPRSGKLSPISLEERVPRVQNQPPSPDPSSGHFRNSPTSDSLENLGEDSRSGPPSVHDDNSEGERRKASDRATRAAPNERCAPVVGAAEQRRMLLRGGYY